MKKLFVLVLSMALVISGCSVSNNKDFNPTEEIVVITREDGSGTRGAFVELTRIEEKDTNGNKVDRTTKEAITQMKTDTVLTTVAGNQYSIGYISMGSLNDTIKPLDVDGISPTTKNIKNGSYKIARPFNIATKGDLAPETEDFIKFIMSAEGQEIVSKSYIAIDDGAEPYTPSNLTGKIVIAGSSSVSPLMEKLKEAYNKINENIQIEVQQSDSSSGLQAVVADTAQIGMASRDLKDSEKKELNSTAIALDGIAIIVNQSNPIANITMEDIRDIFIGEITDWNGIK